MPCQNLSTPEPASTSESPPPPARSLAGHHPQGAPLAPSPAAIVIPTQEDIEAARKQAQALRATYCCPSCSCSSLVAGMRKKCRVCAFFLRGNASVYGKAFAGAKRALGISFRDYGTPAYDQAKQIAELAREEALLESYRMAHLDLGGLEVAS